jgi:hypothetical protein
MRRLVEGAELLPVETRGSVIRRRVHCDGGHCIFRPEPFSGHESRDHRSAAIRSLAGALARGAGERSGAHASAGHACLHPRIVFGAGPARTAHKHDHRFEDERFARRFGRIRRKRLMDQLARHNAEARAQHLRENRARAYGEAESVCGFCATGKPKKPPLHDDS